MTESEIRQQVFCRYAGQGSDRNGTEKSLKDDRKAGEGCGSFYRCGEKYESAGGELIGYSSSCDLTSSQGVMEKENVLLKKMADVLNSRVEQLEKETLECRSLAEAERKKAQEVRPIEPLKVQLFTQSTVFLLGF